jgi:hypothetical protein
MKKASLSRDAFLLIRISVIKNVILKGGSPLSRVQRRLSVSFADIPLY